MANNTNGHDSHDESVGRATMGIFFVFISLSAGRKHFTVEKHTGSINLHS